MTQDTPTSATKSRKNIFSWSISSDELKHQVENYSTLRFIDSYRGAAITFVLVMLGLSIVLAIFDVVPLDSGTMVEWCIYVVALYFMYKGHRWAIILIMFLWTGDKAYQLYEVGTAGQGNAFVVIFWWLILMPYLYKALRIENERRKLAPVAVSVDAEVKYCPKCGSKEDKDAKFCTNCGFNLGAIDVT